MGKIDKPCISTLHISDLVVGSVLDFWSQHLVQMGELWPFKIMHFVCMLLAMLLHWLWTGPMYCRIFWSIVQTHWVCLWLMIIGFKSIFCSFFPGWAKLLQYFKLSIWFYSNVPYSCLSFFGWSTTDIKLQMHQSSDTWRQRNTARTIASVFWFASFIGSHKHFYLHAWHPSSLAHEHVMVMRVWVIVSCIKTY